jgi:hypothetical protein
MIFVKFFFATKTGKMLQILTRNTKTQTQKQLQHCFSRKLPAPQQLQTLAEISDHNTAKIFGNAWSLK